MLLYPEVLEREFDNWMPRLGLGPGWVAGHRLYRNRRRFRRREMLRVLDALRCVPSESREGDPHERAERVHARITRNAEERGVRGRPPDLVQPEVESGDGTRIRFERIGDGRPVIVVGEAGGTRATMRPLAEALGQHFAVVNYDRRGCRPNGDSSPSPVEREIEDIKALIDAAGGTASVYGHSSGASLALQAAAHELSITKLVLHEPPCTAGEKGGLRRIGVATDLGGRVSHPALVLVGGKSSESMKAAGRQLADAMPKGTRRVLDERDDVDPDRLARVLAEFLRD